MKKALLVIGIIIAIILVIALFLPSTVRVDRSTVINAPVEIVYDQVIDLEKYLKWSPWSAKDPNMKVEWMDQKIGPGAGYSWEGNDQVGKGVMTIEEAVPNSMIRNKLDFGMMGAGFGIWTFEPVFTEGHEGDLTPAKTNVTWTLESNLDHPIPLIGRYFGVFMDFDAAVGPDFEQGLENLKVACEAIRPEPEINMETMEVVEVTMLSIKDSVAMNEMDQKMGEMFGEIVDFMNANDIEIRSQPLCVYHVWNEEGGYSVMEAGIPIAASNKVKPKGRIKRSSIPGGQVVRAVHMGAYGNLGKTHYAIDEWMKVNGKEMRGGPWEVYITDPANTPDTNQWITEVYYPIQ